MLERMALIRYNWSNYWYNSAAKGIFCGTNKFCEIQISMGSHISLI